MFSLVAIILIFEELLKDDPLNPQVPHLRVIGNSRVVVILISASETTPSDHLPALSLKSRKRLPREPHPPSFWPGGPLRRALLFLRGNCRAISLSTLQLRQAPALAPKAFLRVTKYTQLPFGTIAGTC